MSEKNRIPGSGFRKRYVLLIAAFCFFLIFLPAAAVIFALTPYAIREIWLPGAAEAAGAVIRADELYVESFFPFRLKAVNFHYSDPEITVEIRSAVSRLRTGKLNQRVIELSDTRIHGIRVISRPPQPRNPSRNPKRQERKNRPEETEDWIFAMKNFQVENAVLEVENRERKTIQIWSAKSLKGNRFLTGKPCSLAAEAAVAMAPDKRNPLTIRSLPFQLQAEYLLDSGFRLKDFKIALKTGICDLSITEEIVIPPEAGIHAAVHLEGSCPTADSLRIIRSETHLFQGRESIGKLLFQGTFDETFQCEGVFSGLNTRPYLSILAPESKVTLEVPHAEFSITGSDFSPTGIRRDLKAHLIAELKQLSIPMELNRNSRIMRLIMIPVEAMPTLVELLEMRWNLQHEINNCLSSVKAAVSGKQNLNFERAKMDLALENGILKITDITLHGKDIEMESIQGKLNLVSEKLNIKTILVIGGIKLPLQFRGTLNDPSPRFRNAVKDFVLLNAPLLQKLEELLTEPPSKNDSRLEKAIKRGHRSLYRFLQ